MESLWSTTLIGSCFVGINEDWKGSTMKFGILPMANIMVAMSLSSAQARDVKSPPKTTGTKNSISGILKCVIQTFDLVEENDGSYTITKRMNVETSKPFQKSV